MRVSYLTKFNRMVCYKRLIITIIFLIFILGFSNSKSQSINNNEFQNDSLNKRKIAEIDSVKFLTENQILLLDKELSDSLYFIDSLSQIREDTLRRKIQVIDEQIALIENSFLKQTSNYFRFVITGDDKLKELKNDRLIPLKVLEMRLYVTEKQKQELDSIYFEKIVHLREKEEKVIDYIEKKYDNERIK